METGTTHHVLVDFENIQDVDLSLVDGHPVQVKILLGRHQRKLDVRLVQGIRKHADKVELIEVDATGHNALDMILAYHLGAIACQQPGARYCIVSKDKHFGPLATHLLSLGLKVSRHDSFANLPFLAPPPAVRRAQAPRGQGATGRGEPKLEREPREPRERREPREPRESREARGRAPKPVDPLKKIKDRLESTIARPAKRKTLVSDIRTLFPEAEESQVEDWIHRLEEDGVLVIDDRERVRYRS